MTYYKYSKKTKNLARANRRQKNMTSQEGKLWHIYLKKCKFKFKRQFRIGNYILDFYCPTKKLCVEIDGSQHYEGQNLQNDEERTKFLNQNGITVIRFSNFDIDTNIHNVVVCIYKHLSLKEEDVV